MLSLSAWKRLATLLILVACAAPATASAKPHHRHRFTADACPAQLLTVINDEGVPASVLYATEQAVRWQADRQLRRWWHTPCIRFGPGGWPVYLTNYADANVVSPSGQPIPAGDAGYHSFVRQMPFAIVGSPGPAYFMPALFSHEIVEMLVDPWDLGYEVCDPVENGLYAAPNGVLLSDFVLPAWFSGHAVSDYDVLGLLRGAGQSLG